MTQGLGRTEASSNTIADLLVLVENGSIRIPRFQRGQRWGPGDIVKLFDSIYKGYPIGTLLLWKRYAQQEEVTLGPIRVQAPERRDALWIVDGQQRVTSLATVLLPADPVVPTPPALYFDLAAERFVWQRPNGPRDNHLPVLEAHKLPNVMAWLRKRNLDEPLQERAFKLADRLRNYRVPSYAVETESEGDLAPLREIFDRINTFGKRMNRAEVFHALTSASTPGSRDLPYLADKIDSWGFGSIANNTLLLCVLSVRGSDVLRDFRAEFANGSERLAAAIDDAEKAISRTITFLRDDAAVPHLDLVPYQHLLVALVRFFALHKNPSEWDRVLLRRWYWRAAVHGPLPKLGSTGTLRLALNTIDMSSAFDTVAGLLDMFPSEKRTAGAERLRWNRADSKTTLCALARLGPLMPTGALDEVAAIDVTRALTVSRHDALPRIFLSLTGELAGSAANRVFWQPHADNFGSEDQEDSAYRDESGGLENADRPDDLTIVLASAGSRVLASHAISTTAVQALRRGSTEDFLATRLSDIQNVVEGFVDARAEWEHTTRPALASL